MSRVAVGYGEYVGYLLAELPPQILAEIGARYPLRLDEDASPDYEILLITVAVHAEIARRQGGEQQRPRVPTLREVAEEIVTKGFQQASKNYHPDGQGHHEAQLRLTQARDELRTACANIADDYHEEEITIISAPDGAPRSRPRSAASPGIDEDDVPF